MTFSYFRKCKSSFNEETVNENIVINLFASFSLYAGSAIQYTQLQVAFVLNNHFVMASLTANTAAMAQLQGNCMFFHKATQMAKVIVCMY